MSGTQSFKNKLTIGILDSGVGGLTVLRPLLKRAYELGLKHNPHFIYLADTKRFPYGQRTPTQIHEFACQMIGWLASKQCDVVVIACHTISTVAAFSTVDKFSSVAFKHMPVPIFDMGKIGSWLTIPEAKKIVVLSTPATVKTAAISKSIAASHPASLVLEIGCPELASIIEQGATGNKQGAADNEHGMTGSDQLHEILSEYAQKIINACADSVILGCTHYPFIADLLGQLLPSKIKIIDPAIQFADYFFEQLGFKLSQGMQAKNSSSAASKSEIETAFYVSGNLEEFKSKLNNYTPDLHGTVSPVTIDELKSSSFSASDLMST